MRGRTALLASTCALAVTAAHADVSDNLVFCSKLGNSRERIACYDAAARIAANAGPSTKPTRPATAPISRSASAISDAALSERPALPVRFWGPYVFAYGGFAPGLRDVSGTEFSRIDAKIAGIGAGYNFSYGALVTGVEARGYKELGTRDVATGSANLTPFPIFIGSSFGPGIPQLSSWTIGGFSFAQTLAERGFGGDLAWRVGVAPTDWLLFYAKVGGGVQEFKYHTASSFGSINCLSPIISQTLRANTQFDQRDNFIVGCGSVQQPFSTSLSERHSYIPYYLIGTGVEASLGQWFARLEGEIHNYVNHPNFGLNTRFYTASGNLAVGFRF